jgi:hypothetical protein
MKTWELAARTYDILRVDPLALGAGATKELAFAFDDKTLRTSADGRTGYPVGMVFTAAAAGEERSDISVLTSAHDFLHAFSATRTVIVADGRGKACCGTLSESFQTTQKTTENFDNTETIARTMVPAYRLDITGDPSELRLAPALERALRALPATGDASAPFLKFLRRFGTHFSQRTVMGGIAHQRLTIGNTDVVRMLTHGLNVKGEAVATFEAVKAGAQGTAHDATDPEFQNATHATRSSITYRGGMPGATFADFVATVPENPTAIELALVPLYDLLIPAFFRDVEDLAARRELLKRKTEMYLAANGADPMYSRLRFGDTVRLDQAGMNRALGSGNSYVSVRAVPDMTTHTPRELQWRLVRADDPGYTGDVEEHHRIALRSVADHVFLDALGGRDDEYSSGVGLAASRGTDPAVTSAQWRIRLVDGLRRTAAVEGDLIRLETVDPGWNNRTGYLYGEDSGTHRVFSFVGDMRPGAIWQIVRT